MKANIWKIGAALAAFAAIFAGCSPTTKTTTPTVVISALSGTFDGNGSASVVLTLSSKASEDVVVSLAASGDYASELTFDKQVTISAGNSKQVVPVTLNMGAVKSAGSAVITIQSASGATVGSPKEATLTIVAPEVPTINIASADESFSEQGAAKISLSLSRALAEDITVKLALQEEVEDAVTIPADAVTFDSEVVIKAGEVSKDVALALNMSVLVPGENALIIYIQEVTGGVTIGKKADAYISNSITITPTPVKEWTVEYTGDGDYEGSPCSYIKTSGIADGENYYIRIFEAGVLSENFKTLDEVVMYFESYIRPLIGTDNAPYFETGSQEALPYNVFSPYVYEVVLLGCDEKGYLNGKYSYGSFEVEASAEAVEAYNKWLGSWKVARGGSYDTWDIIEGYPGGYFYIFGIDGGRGDVDNCYAKAEYDYENDAIIIYGQSNLDSYVYDGKTYEISLLALAGGGKLYSTTSAVAKIVKTDDNTAVVQSPGSITGSDGSEYPIEGMLYFGVPEGENNGFVYVDEYYSWPANMTRVVADETNEAFNAFLGTWGAKRHDTPWNADTQSYMDNGEVIDTITVSSDIAGVRFVIDGLMDMGLSVYADFGAETSTLSLYEQTCYVEDDFKVKLCGLILYQEKEYLWDGGKVILTAKVVDGNIELTPSEAHANYGNFVGMKLFAANSDGTYGSWHQNGYALPATWTSIEAEVDEPTPSAAVPGKPFAKTEGISFKPAKAVSQKDASGLFREYERVAR